MLVALALAYRGDPFHGSQMQPDVETVQGCLQDALKRLDWRPELLRLSSRTDAGVHARMNLARIWAPDGILDGGNRRVLRALNDLLPASICVWDAQPIDSAVDLRHASSRTYRYRLEMLSDWNSSIAMAEFESILEIFEGEHDFSNFCRLEAGRDPRRSVESCTPWIAVEGRIIGFEMTASGFLWNQVRRIAAAIVAVASEQVGQESVVSALSDPTTKADFGMCPGEWLVLWVSEHPALSFTPSGNTSDPASPDKSDVGRWVEKLEQHAESLSHRAWLSREFAALLSSNTEANQSR